MIAFIEVMQNIKDSNVVIGNDYSEDIRKSCLFFYIEEGTAFCQQEVLLVDHLYWKILIHSSNIDWEK